ncbi:MAG: tRNA preQ1(34) S-adenosylmethionine ribosyltransferase-isomerase QueA [Bdellovibrionota bacterium]
MRTESFDFELSPDRIAQHPLEPRHASKLMVCQGKGSLGSWNSGSFKFFHKSFFDLSELLTANDFLVLNDAKVLPVRLLGRRREGTGGAVEALLLRRNAEREWSALLHLSARVRPGLEFLFEPGLVAEVLSTHEERLANEGEVRLRFSGLSLDRISLETWLERYGHVPLPPYIERDDRAEDKKAYQTVYAAKQGSAAAPTAGFHFTGELLEKLQAKGVEMAHLTLHVGLGTFRPIKTETVEEHKMHRETFELSTDFMQAFANARRRGKRIVAVGTTVVRALETWALLCDERKVELGSPESTGIFETQAYIHPGPAGELYPFRVVQDLITNFHLPRSSLLVLVGAAMGVEPVMQAYRLALEREYRFFSYGDAMFITGEDRKL